MDEISKCTEAIKVEAETEDAEEAKTVAHLHEALSTRLPAGTAAEVTEHAKVVVEAVLLEALNRPDGKGSHHCDASMDEGLAFLAPYISPEALATVTAAASDIVRSAAEQKDGGDPPSGDERIVDLRNIILAYPGRVLLQRSHLHMDRGHCYGLVGQNGVGKTTIMTRIAKQDIHNFPTHLKCVYVQHEVHRGVNDGETVLSFMRSQACSQAFPRGCSSPQKTLPSPPPPPLPPLLLWPSALLPFCLLTIPRECPCLQLHQSCS